MANQTASSKAGESAEAPEAPIVLPAVEEVASKVGPTSVLGVPKSGADVVRYVGLSKDYVGLKGSHREMTKTQFKEAGVQEPFTDARTSVIWNTSNGYMVPKSVFSDAALLIIDREDDLIFDKA